MFAGIYWMSVIPGFLRWCRISSIRIIVLYNHDAQYFECSLFGTRPTAFFLSRTHLRVFLHCVPFSGATKISASHVIKARVDGGEGRLPAINSCGSPPSEFLKHGAGITTSLISLLVVRKKSRLCLASPQKSMLRRVSLKGLPLGFSKKGFDFLTSHVYAKDTVIKSGLKLKGGDKSRRGFPGAARPAADLP